MKRLLCLSLLLASCSLRAQTNGMTLAEANREASNTVVMEVPAGVATFTNSVMTRLHAKRDIKVVTDAGAVLQPNATANSATHSNFGISAAWLAILIPVLLAFAKSFLPTLPPKYLPMIAILLGAASDALASWLNGNTPNPALGAVLGSAGVGLRELVDQIRNPTPTVPNNSANPILPTPPAPVIPKP